jgi:hypothetical protein
MWNAGQKMYIYTIKNYRDTQVFAEPQFSTLHIMRCGRNVRCQRSPLGRVVGNCGQNENEEFKSSQGHSFQKKPFIYCTYTLFFFIFVLYSTKRNWMTKEWWIVTPIKKWNAQKNGINITCKLGQQKPDPVRSRRLHVYMWSAGPQTISIYILQGIDQKFRMKMDKYANSANQFLLIKKKKPKKQPRLLFLSIF